MDRFRRRIDVYTAPLMFAVGFMFLLCLAGVLHLRDENGMHPAAVACVWGMAALYPLFLVETVLHRVLGYPLRKRHLLVCLLPPLRIAGRDHRTGTALWLPRSGWLRVDSELQHRLEKAFSLPMILIALMVLPLMAVDHFGGETLQPGSTWGVLVQAATGLIWLAFTFEFIIMISLVDKKWRYCKEHWIDVLVILLPLVAFLRAARLGRLLRLQQLARTVRVYRLRGMLMRAYRALLLLEVIDRLLQPDPENRLKQLHEMLALKEQELDEIRQEIHALEADDPAVPITRKAA